MNFSKPDFINGKHYYKIPEEAYELSNIDRSITHYPISVESLREIIYKSIGEDTDTDIKSIYGKINYLIAGKLEHLLYTLGIISEQAINAFINENDGNILFSQGSPGKDEADIHCLTNKCFSIELKTKRAYSVKESKPSITGNRAYCDNQDERIKKTKNHFYILINYDFNLNKRVDYKIRRFRAWFGYIKQSDWKAGSNGAGTSTLMVNNEDLQKRLIEIV